MDLRDIQECGLIGYDGRWFVREREILWRMTLRICIRIYRLMVVPLKEEKVLESKMSQYWTNTMPIRCQWYFQVKVTNITYQIPAKCYIVFCQQRNKSHTLPSKSSQFSSSYSTLLQRLSHSESATRSESSTLFENGWKEEKKIQVDILQLGNSYS